MWNPSNMTWIKWTKRCYRLSKQTVSGACRSCWTGYKTTIHSHNQAFKGRWLYWRNWFPGLKVRIIPEVWLGLSWYCISSFSTIGKSFTARRDWIYAVCIPMDELFTYAWGANAVHGANVGHLPGWRLLGWVFWIPCLRLCSISSQMVQAIAKARFSGTHIHTISTPWIDFCELGLGHHGVPATTAYPSLARKGCWTTIIGSLHVENTVP